MDVGSAWANYVRRLEKLDTEATKKVGEYIGSITGFHFTDPEDMNKLVAYAYGISSKYGEGAAALACEMYDAIGIASGQILPPAEPADLPDMDEVAKTVRGTAKTGNPKNVSRSVGRLVKRTGADTTLKNAIRDGAEFAWIPNGDTCAFCITLASRGWQKASASALKGGHADHIHANCDCTYAVSFNGKPAYSNYDPERYLDMYENAEGSSSKDKINSLRRMHYEQNKDRINAQKREAYARRRDTKGQLRIEAANPFKNPETPLSISSYDQSKHIRGGQRYNQYMENHEYEPSVLTISEDEIQKLVEKYHGTGILKLDRHGNVVQNEMIVDNDQVIGYVVNNLNGMREETTGFKIHYSSKGTHIVPMYENQKQYWKSMRDKNGNDWLLRQKS